MSAETPTDSGVPSERWEYEAARGFGTVDTRHLGGEWWIGDDPGDVAVARILRDEEYVTLETGLETADGLDAGVVVKLSPAAARGLAEDLREVADALDEK